MNQNNIIKSACFHIHKNPQAAIQGKGQVTYFSRVFACTPHTAEDFPILFDKSEIVRADTSIHRASGVT